MIETVFTKKTTTPKEEKVITAISAEKDNGLAKQIDSENITQMGIWNKIKLHGEVGKVAREQLFEVAKALVEKQKQEITHHLMLDLDVNKKLAYQHYLDNVGVLNKDLIKRSTEMEGELLDILVDSTEDIFKRKDAWIAKIDALKLSDEDHKKEMDNMNEWIDLAKGQINGKVRLLIETHSESIRATLQLLKDTTLEGKG